MEIVQSNPKDDNALTEIEDLRSQLIHEKNRFHMLQAELDIARVFMGQEIDKHKRECMNLKVQLCKVEEDRKLLREREAKGQKRIKDLLQKLENSEKELAEKIAELKKQNRNVEHEKVVCKVQTSWNNFQTKHKRNRNNESSRIYKGRMPTNEQKGCAQIKAEKLQKRLKSCNMFIKTIVLSNVSKSYKLVLPLIFCEENLSHQGEAMMTLEDENEVEYKVKFIPGRKSIFSGGWRRFVVAKKLEIGDALVFEQIEATRFKVHIIKAIDDSTVQSPHAEIAGFQDRAIILTE